MADETERSGLDHPQPLNQSLQTPIHLPGNVTCRQLHSRVLQSPKTGKNVMYAIDQDYGWDHSIKLKFFNQEAATITTTRKIIDATNSNLLFINSYYKKNKLVIKIELIDHFGLDSIELAQKINNLMEEKILQHPAEYLWIHRRFKSTLGKNFYK